MIRLPYKTLNGYTLTDLFCGAGGATEGLKCAGFEPVRAADKDGVCTYSYNLNFGPGTARTFNLMRADPEAPWWRATDVLWASPPCTHHSRGYNGRKDYSALDRLAKGAPLHEAERDPENAAMFVVPKFAAAHRYPYIVVENVPEVQKWPLFPHWLTQMRRLGYSYKAQLINAAKARHPVPQTRIRYIGIFWLPEYVEPEGIPQDSPIPGVKTILEPEAGGFLKYRERPLCETTMARIQNTLDAFPNATRWVIPYLSSRKRGGSDDLPVCTLTRRIRHCVITKTPDGDCYRMLTRREQARLMGFPDRFTFTSLGAVRVEQQIGNAVCVNVAYAIGLALAKALDAS